MVARNRCLSFDVHKKPPKLYDFKAFRSLLLVHKNGKTYYEDMLDKSASIFTIFFAADKELKQPSRAIIREKPTLEEENHQKIIKTRSLLQQQFCYTQTDTVRGY